jgi:hypothetical protein
LTLEAIMFLIGKEVGWKTGDYMGKGGKAFGIFN